MNQKNNMNYLIVAGVGAVVGGIVVAVTTQAIPQLMESISNTMMGKMKKRMQEEGCTPAEM